MNGEAQKKSKHGFFYLKRDTSTNEIIDTNWMAKILPHSAKQLMPFFKQSGTEKLRRLII
jgi:hypothetical protein